MSLSTDTFAVDSPTPQFTNMYTVLSRSFGPYRDEDDNRVVARSEQDQVFESRAGSRQHASASHGPYKWILLAAMSSTATDQRTSACRRGFFEHPGQIHGVRTKTRSGHAQRWDTEAKIEARA